MRYFDFSGFKELLRKVSFLEGGAGGVKKKDRKINKKKPKNKGRAWSLTKNLEPSRQGMKKFLYFGKDVNLYSLFQFLLFYLFYLFVYLFFDKKIRVNQ